MTGKSFIRFSQVTAIAFLPAIVFFLFFFEIEDKVFAPAVVEAKNQVVMTSPSEDTIVDRILFRSGERVEKGQPVVILMDRQDLTNRTEKKELSLKVKRERVEKMRKLMNSGGLSKKEFETYELDVLSEESDLRALRASLENLTVRAPFSGRLTVFHVELREKVDIGTPLFTIFGDGPKVLNCAVSERHRSYVRPGQRVNIKSELYNYLRFRVYEGKVSEVSPYGKHDLEDAGKVYYKVLVDFDDEESQKLLTVGSSANCEIIVGQQPLFFILTSGTGR